MGKKDASTVIWRVYIKYSNEGPCDLICGVVVKGWMEEDVISGVMCGDAKNSWTLAAQSWCEHSEGMN